ncbi:MAG: DnaJ domain-containing protein [Patescibacteria group bacterium]|jgi:DnaJ like chaperone protein
MALYHYSIQRYLDQWVGKTEETSSQQTKERRQHAHTSAKEEQRKRDKQNQQQSKGYTENQKHKDERYFETILGLKPGKTSTDIKNRYRELVMQYHPDRVAHLGPKLREFAEQQMKEINEAYDFFKEKYGLS